MATRSEKGKFTWDRTALADKLSVSDHALRDICYPNLGSQGIPCADVTRPMAVAALRRLAATGEVRFDLADDKTEAVS